MGSRAGAGMSYGPREGVGSRPLESYQGGSTSSNDKRGDFTCLGQSKAAASARRCRCASDASGVRQRARANASRLPHPSRQRQSTKSYILLLALFTDFLPQNSVGSLGQGGGRMASSRGQSVLEKRSSELSLARLTSAVPPDHAVARADPALPHDIGSITAA